MNVKKILLNVCTMLQLSEEATDIENNHQSEEVKLLVACLNYVNNIIATDYIKIYKTVEVDVKNSGDIVPFSKISQHTFLGIKSVKNKQANKINFKITDSGVQVAKGGKLLIRYAYFPDDVSINDNITCYKTKINERILAYGVAGEYLFIKGIVDDASMWDMRFKRELLVVCRKLTQPVLPSRKFK